MDAEPSKPEIGLVWPAVAGREPSPERHSRGHRRFPPPPRGLHITPRNYWPHLGLRRRDVQKDGALLRNVATIRRVRAVEVAAHRVRLPPPPPPLASLGWCSPAVVRLSAIALRARPSRATPPPPLPDLSYRATLAISLVVASPLSPRLRKVRGVSRIRIASSIAAGFRCIYRCVVKRSSCPASS